MNIHRAKGNTSSSSELIDYHVGFPEREKFYNDEKTCEMISRLVGIFLARIEVKKHLFYILF